MKHLILSVLLSSVFVSTTHAQTMMLSISSNDFQVNTVFSEVDTFDITIEIDAPLAPGAYVDPDIISVVYSVSGTLVMGTPSGFPAFALQRDIAGTEFYAQGSSLEFEISPTAVLTDGVQAIELVGNGVVFIFNGKEVGNGRFHPALLELNSDGTGRIQNSDNIIVEIPLQQVDFGEEYITDLVFDPGNTTLITGTVENPPPKRNGGGSMSPLAIVVLILLLAGIGRTRGILDARKPGH